MRVTSESALVRIEERLSLHCPQEIPEPASARAAVAIILREQGDDAEFVAIHRAHRRGDPWSGHMALPGGRQQPEDRDLLATAARETREEIGIDLQRTGRSLGLLDELPAVARGTPLDLILRPSVWAIRGPVEFHLNPAEVQSAMWISLASLRRPDSHGLHEFEWNGQRNQYPAFLHQGHTIWGLTHRVLTSLLHLLEKP